MKSPGCWRKLSFSFPGDVETCEFVWREGGPLSDTWLVIKGGLSTEGQPGNTPRKLIWNPKMEVWKMIFLFNWVIFRFHVSFPGGGGWDGF